MTSSTARFSKQIFDHTYTRFYDLILQLVALQEQVQKLASQEASFAEVIPVKWFEFEARLSKLVSQGTHVMSLNQVRGQGKCNKIT